MALLTSFLALHDICVEVVTIDMIHYAVHMQYISNLKFFPLHKQVYTQLFCNLFVQVNFVSLILLECFIQPNHGVV